MRVIVAHFLLLAWLAVSFWLTAIHAWMFLVLYVLASLFVFLWMIVRLPMPFFTIKVFCNCPAREWSKWRRHHRELLQRPYLPERAITLEPQEKTGEIRKETEIVRLIVEDIAREFGVPLELLRPSDRFGQELYLPHGLQGSAECNIFGLLDLCFYMHGIESRLEEFPGRLRGMSVKEVIDWISNVVRSAGVR